ncbi:BTB domain-containing protein [Favolaschia claudopus]|uniref:BTB domain-containing protein n=1 Tax=Favolaschia claudopus TaxID=2862362 RepID=A0AAW0BRK1_9AGAR
MSTVRRKRARVDTTAAADAEPEPASEPVAVAPQITRAEKYYFEDGDLVLRAESTLFRVHKFVLSRDSSMFKDMFVIPGGSAASAADGSNDETPLVVSDSASSMTALLWVLYALPPELQAYLSSDKNTVDLDRLLLVAEITNKYHFTSIEEWSLQVIRAVVPKLKFTSSTSTLLVRALTLAERFADSALIDTVLTAWETLVRTVSKPAELITKSDTHPWLIAFAYHTQVSTMKLKRHVFAKDLTLEGCDGLSQTHITKLLFGRWSLEAEVTRLASNPPALPSTGCVHPGKHQDDCDAQWRKAWGDAVNSKAVAALESTDLLGRLKAIQAHLAALNTRKSIHNGACYRKNREVAIATLIARKKRTLHEHFQLPGNFTVGHS